MKQPVTSEDKLAQAQKAFEKFYARCFWYMRPDLKVGEQDLPSIIEGLRKYGNREAFLIAAELCR